MNYKLGIDVGGTFTDFILIAKSGETNVHKTLSTPEDPSIGVINGIRDLAANAKVELSMFVNRIETIVHGTTVATNALLTLGGAKTALITTKGLRDALEMRRGVREEQYNNHYRNVTPLIPRYLRLTVDERIDSQGEILSALDVKELDPIIEQLRSEKVRSVAICYMNAFKNVVHEIETAAYMREHFPEAYITASTEVLPSIRFYERVSTTAVNAYIGPVVADYLGNLTGKLKDINYHGSLLIMQSHGGVVSRETVMKSPAVTVLSGPASAPTAGVFYANMRGYKDCITIDMGGTSFDASLIIDNQCVTSTDGEINRYKVALPALDIATIGAGGGSIGWIDNGGLLQMGPQSAGAMPGPICYGRGGKQPTCTDANLVLGYLNPNYFAGGKTKLDSDLTRKTIETGVASKLELSTLETAVGMFRIININMAQGVREITIERGYDPREFLILVAAGAGPIHSGEICKELEIPLFVVPNFSSIFCAAGMLIGDLKHDYIKSYITPLSEINGEEFLKLFQQMQKEGMSTLNIEGVAESDVELYPVLDLRYVGQYHEVQQSVSWEDVMAENFDEMKIAFHREHNRLFGYSLEEEGTEIELINVRLRVVGNTEKPQFISSTEDTVTLVTALKEHRQVYIPESNDMQEIPVYDGDLNLNGNTITGPAIIERVTTSILVSSSYDCLVDDYGSFIVYSREAFPDGFKTITK